ncbi:hypothetical protein CL622_06420 [archaeon]|nr:hypothetical protein [archaeon]|tara:strand:- start:2874 stop:3656 length:783 start_codon:yes stop_codon:yes gene_type:complete
MDKLVIRPSSIDTFLQCPQQWKRVFIDGVPSIPSGRAALGTAIHKAVEVMWNESIAAKEKSVNQSAMTDAAVEAFKEEEQHGLSYDTGDTRKSLMALIVPGTDAFIEDIVPYADIPEAVEKRYTVEIPNHPLVEAISGTVDYDGTTMADTKTSKRKPTVSNYTIQQSTYKLLREKNGETVIDNQIHGIVLKKDPEGMILPAHIDMDLAKSAINSLLHTLEVYAEDKVDPDLLFRGNPKYYLCSPKYCAFYDTCKFRKGYV